MITAAGTRTDGGLLARSWWLAGALLVGCSTVPAPSYPRPALPLPAAIAEYYALDGPVTEDYFVRLGKDSSVYRGRLTCGDEHPEFHVILPERTPAPLLLCLPILAGGMELMEFIAGYMAERGYAVAWGNRVESALKTHQSAADVEELFRRSIRHNRAVLRWAERQDWAQPGAHSILGISTGGILAGTMMALEPDLDAGVLILAGGDLPDLLDHSSESRIVKWRRHRRTVDDLGEAGLRLRMRQVLRSDPARTAAYVATDKVLMVMAGLDTVVPHRNRELLWEGFGRPERLQLPLFSHYSALLGIHQVLSEADAFLRRKTERFPAR
jgi:dienelactone hydrolase